MAGAGGHQAVLSGRAGHLQPCTDDRRTSWPKPIRLVSEYAATVTGTSCRIGHLKAKNAYAVKVLALPAAPGQKPTTAYTTTK